MEIEGEGDRGGDGMQILGYVIQKHGKQEVQVKDRIRKAVAVMGQVW